MTTKFYLNKFIYIFFGTQIFIYLCWSFIELSFLTPLLDTFKTSESRGFYLMVLFIIIFMGIPFYYPYNDNNK